MRLTINGVDVRPALGALRLEKREGDAAAALTATLYQAVADTYFLQLSLAVGDVVRLTDDDGRERFLGSIHALERTPEWVRVTAFDRGVYLSRNEVHGVFAGSGGDICRAVAAQLGISCGTLEAQSGYQVLSALHGQSAFSVLRKAAGEGRDVALEGETLTVRRRGGARYLLQPAQVQEVSAAADMRKLCDHVTVVDYKGRTVATARRDDWAKRYGVFRRVLGKSGTDPQTQANDALRGCVRSAQAVVDGNLGYRCGDVVECRAPQWGLEGDYRVTAVSHRWEKGRFTTELTLEGLT